jgi:dethiobiotin synthetase
MKNNFFVTGIDTDSGKTLVCAILCEALRADYWKPVQAGMPRDADTVEKLVTNSKTKIYPETFLLNTPASPHAAAKIDGVKIRVKDFTPPVTANNLIVEGAGGCLVPLNEEEFIIDLIVKLKLPIILVADLYLGSINHSLLTIEALQKRKLRIEGIIFNGPPNPESEDVILRHSKLKCLLNIVAEKEINPAVVTGYAAQFIKNWK